MTQKDKEPSAEQRLKAMAYQLWMSGESSSRHEAIQRVLKQHPALALEVTTERLDKELRKEGIKKATWPGEKWDQLVLLEGDHRYQVPDLPVRYPDENGKPDTKPRRFSTTKEAVVSVDESISDHDRATRRLQRVRTIEEDTETQMHLDGFDTTLTWDENRHRNTICARCGLGWIRGDPFVHGHTTAKVVGGGDDQIKWEHHSCNSGARGNPQ